ncbi:MAG: nucleotidyltransferase domain-containing protein [Actinomycetota bacterium]|nr:nucleotidyltransferase domain-containing protein [Actinomycetota bacterium]
MATELAEVARHTDDVTAQARAELVRAVRQAAAQGMTQIQIARQIGRSQPEVSRLLRFHGTTPLARNLRREAEQIRCIVADAGGSRLRVFGSVATGHDRPDSDVDLLFVMNEPLSLMRLGRIEREVSDLLGVPVDLVPESALRPDLRERILTEAVAL